MPLRNLLLATAMALVVVHPLYAQDTALNAYKKEVFVANRAKYKPASVDKHFVNAWGLAIRPKGAGGHFWVAAKDISYEYVGDVKASADEALRTLHQDALKIVTLPVGGNDTFATGVVFSDSKDNFVITQTIKGAEPVTAPAKFIFASDGGVISAWTERKKEDGTFDRAGYANAVIDQSPNGAQYFGLAINEDYSRLYAANFGKNPNIQVFDGDFKPANLPFDQPFDANKNGRVDPGEYAPFNVQALNGHIFVAYALTQACPLAEVKKGSCKKGELFAGEEDTAKPGSGRVAEFTEEGKLIAVWNDGGKLSAPWGMAFAPSDFGALSGALLVANFGDGTIAAYNASTREFIDVLRDGNGKPIVIDKIWGLLFGNGESLGDVNALYYTAGPDDEKDGEFGSLRLIAAP